MEEELSAWEKVPDINKKTNVIVVDSYFVTNAYLRGIRKYGYVLLMDDLGAGRFCADGILNYNVFADPNRYQKLYKEGNTELFLGSGYVPLRPQFREKNYEVRKRAGEILITTGGGDIDNIAAQILKELEACLGESASGRGSKTSGKGPVSTDSSGETAGANKITDEMLNYHLVIGTFNPHFQEMENLAKVFPHVHIHHDVADMASLMERCDLAITAGGSTVYELAAIGVPFICFSYAENQEPVTEYLGREGIASFAGAFHREGKVVLRRIAEQAMGLLRDYDKRYRCYLKERTLTDGSGAEKIAKLLAERAEWRESKTCKET